MRKAICFAVKEVFKRPILIGSERSEICMFVDATMMWWGVPLCRLVTLSVRSVVALARYPLTRQPAVA